VDDDVVIRKTARKLLEKSGVHVVEAATVMPPQTSPDRRLRGHDGLGPRLAEARGREVLRAVRKDAKTAGLPVVVLTGENGKSGSSRS